MLVLTLALSATLAPTADAAFGFSAFDGAAVGPDAQAFTQAGGHPHALTTTFDLNTTLDSTGNLTPEGGLLKNVQVELPPGLIGNPTAVGQCKMGDFLRTVDGFPCPPSTQIGVALVKIGIGSTPQLLPLWPVYSLEPSPGAVASFGFGVVGIPIFLDAYVRSAGGYHVVVEAHDASQGVVVAGSSITLWGNPSDPAHDPDRACQGTSSKGCSTEPAARPFLTNPTSCPPVGEGLETVLRADSWSAPGQFTEARFVSHETPGYTFANPLPPAQWGPVVGTTGCVGLPFKPSLAVAPTSTLPDSPGGLSVDLSFPQDGLESQAGTATPHLRRARVTLPEGMTISPSSADGLEACSDSQVGIGSDAAPACPRASKVGTVTARTPVLDEALDGAVYVGTQGSDDPESGRMFRIFLTLDDEARGLHVKLPGQVRVDRQTGRIETVFDNNPQLPVSSVSVRLEGGPRAPLAMPPDCGTKTVEAELTSWAGQVAHVTDSLTIDCAPGAGGFSPSFVAGTVNPTGGAFSPFTAQIDRPDRQQYLAGVAVTTPGGILAKLRGVLLCGDAAATTGACPAASRVGTATVGAGPGSNPFFLKGSVSLTGPYGGAPYGLSVAVRALAGPFDLGTVVVRQAIFVDPANAHLLVRSDPLPMIVKGVPVRLRSVELDIDKPGFTKNPTSCAPKRIDALFTSALGTLARESERFQAGECALLGFSPKLALRLTGRGQTSDGKHPGLRAVLTQGPGQAGIRGASVRLPLALALDPGNAVSDTLCEFEEGQKADPHCPRSSIVGRAKAISPLLNRPLAGNVYFVKNVRIDRRTKRRIRTLPTLLMALRGEVALNLRAKTSISGNRLVSSFPTIPDAPVSRFELNIGGGRRGILVVTTKRSVCRGRQLAGVAMAGQNGKRVSQSTAIRTPCRGR